jgi:tetratricopeptide (TPR) repeat protein
MSERDSEVEGEIERIEVSKLVRTVDACEGRMAFLIGAGTSKPAGIPTSGELIHRWKENRYTDNIPSDEDYTMSDVEEWAESVEPEEDDFNPYGFWFEQVYPAPGARKKFIQDTVEDNEPTVGIVVLASMMNDGYIPLTLTPNFDDLLYDSFYRYLEDKPLLVDHDAIAPQFRLTEDRPTIIKLHGDYLYDNLQNTADETRELGKNMKDVLSKSMEEYGLVVVGYGGRDDSIMAVLTEEEIPNQGLYWCSRSSEVEDLSEETRDVLRKDNAFLVEIGGSEDLFMKFACELDVDVPTKRELMERAEERASSLTRLKRERKKETTEEDEEKFLNISQLRDRAYEYAEEDNLETAIELYDDIIESDSVEARDYYNQGVAYKKLGKHEEAIKKFDRSIGLDHQYADAYYAYGTLLSDLGEHEEALEHLTQAIELDSSLESAYYNRGNTHTRLGNYEKAVEDYTEAIQLNENNPEYYRARGRTNLSMGNPQAAVEDYNQAIELNPKSTNTYQDRSEAKIVLRDPSGALEDANTALSINGESGDEVAISYMLILISKILLDEDVTEEEQMYRKICNEEFETVWSFKELDDWLEGTEIKDDKREKIREVINLLRKHKSDTET